MTLYSRAFAPSIATRNASALRRGPTFGGVDNANARGLLSDSFFGQTLAATGALTASVVIASSGNVSGSSLDATVALIASPALAASGSISIATTGALAANATLASSGALSLASTSAISIAPTLALSGGLSLDATVALTSSAPLAASVAVSVDALAALSLAPTWAGVGLAGIPGPRASRYFLALSLPVRSVSASLPTRSLSVSLARRSLSVSLPARALSVALPRRSLVASLQSFTKGDASTPTFTLSIDTGTIATPTSLAALLYPVGSTTVAATISVATGDCTGWGTASVSVPVAFTSANTPSAGRYSVEIVATYVDGTRRWPDNASAVQLDIKAPGAP